MFPAASLSIIPNRYVSANQSCHAVHVSAWRGQSGSHYGVIIDGHYGPSGDKRVPVAKAAAAVSWSTLPGLKPDFCGAPRPADFALAASEAGSCAATADHDYRSHSLAVAPN